jgi:phytanoyl-CoA hydroxylase
MRDNVALDAVAQLIGPNIKFNNAKINSKHPGSKTNIDYHQDFMFEPNSNDDLITVLIFLDDLTEQNGPLNVVPGSHKGPLYGHWHDQVFTGTVSSAIASKAESDALPCYGPAGSACLMHTRLLHGSGPNYSKQSRTLYIVTYSAEDAYPLQRNSIPSVNAGDIVRGKLTNRVRCSSYEMDFPEMPTGPSFFEQQAKSTRK